MAHSKPSRTKSNFGQFQRYATANVKKQLRKDAEEWQVNIGKVIADELKEKYKTNVLASYSPRSTGSYVHTNTFLESIHTEIEHEPGIGRDRIKIVFDEDKEYPPTLVYDKSAKKMKERTVTVRDVYQWLTEGTSGGGYYKFKKDNMYHTAYNYPTPAHLFEEHTKLQMKSFLETLDVKKYVNIKKYKLKVGGKNK